ncbi:porin family protein [Pollutibacter soli]|uniref:porin family protein n=1 Tax=Pollutibacter soli TaxID=3034157 RepID=UPI00301362E1
MKTTVTTRRSLKTIFLSLATLLSLSVFAQEQQTAAEKTLTPKFGIKAGPSFTNLYIDDINDERMKIGINAGFYAKIPISKGVSFQPELLYANKGTRANYDNFILGSGEYRFNLHYLELPLLFSFNVAKNFNIHAGGYAAYLLGADIKDVNKDGTIQEITTLNADNFNRFDAGLVGGLGFDIQNVTIGARYNYGLVKIGESGSISGELAKNAKNSAIALYVGFAF